MAVISLDFACRKYKHTRIIILSLVSCEHSRHEGPRERIIMKKYAIKGRNVKFCRRCGCYGRVVKESAKQIMREKMSGENNPFFGKKHSVLTREKISVSKTGSKRSIESRKKQSQSISGENHSRWRHDLSQEERETHWDRHYNPENHTWRKAVYERDNYFYQVSGQKGNHNIVAHHLFNYSTHPDKRYDVNNGVTMLEPLHKLFHFIYGNRDNTPSQFEEFKTMLNSNLWFLYLYSQTFSNRLNSMLEQGIIS